jgi:sortase A
MRAARVIGAVGRVCLTAGVLILLFVVYQLWGTGIREAQAQDRLEDEFATLLDDASSTANGSASTATTGTTAPGATTPTTAAPVGPPPPPPDEGGAVARIRIPAIDVDKIVVEGVGLSDLKKGPGHYPDSPLPGQPGNAAIAGHRTTYGAPFNRIDELQPGDEILVTTQQGAFRYEVTEQKIVTPDQTEVLNDFEDNRLTLTACHPKYSARQRIVVVSKLVGPAAPAPPPTTAPPDTSEIPGDTDTDEPASLDAGLSGEGASAWPAIMLGLCCALIWLAAWLVGKAWRKWPPYVVGVPLFLFVLFFFFENFSRLLPSNF